MIDIDHRASKAIDHWQSISIVDRRAIAPTGTSLARALALPSPVESSPDVLVRLGGLTGPREDPHKLARLGKERLRSVPPHAAAGDQVRDPSQSLIGLLERGANLRCELRVRPRATGGTVVLRGTRRRAHELVRAVPRDGRSKQGRGERIRANREIGQTVSKLIWGHGTCRRNRQATGTARESADIRSPGALGRKYCVPAPGAASQDLHCRCDRSIDDRSQC